MVTSMAGHRNVPLLRPAVSLPEGEVHCEAPNNRLDRFTGTLTYAGQKYSLDNEKILLRGCTLRNTEWCFGLVLFGGENKREYTEFKNTLRRHPGE